MSQSEKVKNIAVILTTVFVVLGASSLFAQDWPSKSAGQAAWDAYHARKDFLRKSLLGSHEARKEGVHNGNQIVTLFYNYGSIGKPNTEPSLVWPKGTDHGYGFEFGILVAGEIEDINRIRRHIVSDGLDVGGDQSPQGLPWGWEPLPGYASDYYLDEEGRQQRQEFIAMSDNPRSWPDHWPNKTQNWDHKWIGEYGADVITADQESYYKMDDYANAEILFWPDKERDPNRRGLGLEVEVRGYQWAHTLAQDCIFWVYEVENVGADTLNKNYLGMYGDPHIGGANDYDDDDGYYDTKLDMVYGWDHDFRGQMTAWKPGYLGYKFLESPGNPYDGIDNDEDGMVDESMQDEIDNDHDWDPLLDDVGADGVNGDTNGNGVQDGMEYWDRGERDGVPTHGEPNFDETDLHEADQIGLTSFSVFEYASLWASQDEDIWRLMVSGIVDSTFAQTRDNIFMYSSGPVRMIPHDRRRFSIALLFGYDKNDLYRTARIVQRIYDSGYRFAKAPSKPTLTAVPGDGRVTLYWDELAERSRDPVYGYDFEGYAIYRGTDIGFNDTFVITDAQGNPKLWKPIAQFDLKDGIKGPHPVEQANGIHYYLGDDTGLVHSWTDTTVMNGQRYFYAVVSYDKGDSIEIPPTECTKSFIESPPNSGNYMASINTAIVVPQAPAAGYVPPYVEDYEGGVVPNQTLGGTGKVRVKFLDPNLVKDNRHYELRFDDTTSTATKTFNLRDLDSKVVEMLPVGVRYRYTRYDSTRQPPVPIDSVMIAVIRTSHPDLIKGTVLVQDASGGTTYTEGSDYSLNLDAGWITILNANRMPVTAQYRIEYAYYLIKDSPYLDGSDRNPYVDGMQILVKEDPLQVDSVNSKFTKGKCNLLTIVQKYPSGGTPYPADYDIVFSDHVVAHSYNGKRPAKFFVLNATEGDTSEFAFFDVNGDSTISEQDKVVPLVVQGGKRIGTWQVWFYSLPDSIVYSPSGEPIEILKKRFIPPKPGDVYRIASKKPFTHKDVFRFTTRTPRIEPQRAKSELERVAVVPNPYVAAAEWEPKPDIRSGRGERLLYFIHLPKTCTIRIYTLSGELVQTLYHDSPMEDGSESWNLLSKDQMEIAYGIYLYHVDAPGVGQKIDKFAVIK